ncbi:tripartite tricarboxylate transporter substrate binding protein [Rhodovarius sp.]|uniref:Bug family tripartite tricarboxylate transporter substrate binding protein n=1 Tax=Rhodovarius sp. TaxID=2972673 RepID=UPI0033403531
MMRRRSLLAAPLLAAPAFAQSWRPARPVRVIVPVAPGGTTDIIGRIVAQHLQTLWGGPVVVENRPGAGGTIGSAEMARARPDGLTLLSGNIGSQAIAYSLFRNLPYTMAQQTPIIGTIRGPNVLACHNDVPARNLAEFVAWLRGQRGRAAFGSTGVGQSTHLTPVWMLQLLGVEAVHVPFRGSAPMQTDLLAGNVKFAIDNLTGIIELVRSGRVRALAVTSAGRSPQLPDIPAMREAGGELANFDVNTWFGIFAPPGLPEPALRGINADIRAMLEMPATQARFAELGGVAFPNTPEEFAGFVRDEARRWGEVIRREGLQLDAV